MEMQDLDNALRTFAKKLPEVRKVVVQTIILEVAFAEAEATPVDTGEARSNWLVNQPGRVIPPHVPGRKLGRGETSNLLATIQAAKVQLSKLSYNDNQRILLQNSIHYMESLVRGSSPQANAQFDEHALDEGLRRAQPKVDRLVREMLSR